MSSGLSNEPSKIVDGIFPTFVNLTLKSLAISLEDAKNRYERGVVGEEAVASPNWAVTNQAIGDERGLPPTKEKLLQEEVVLWLNVGEERLEIVPGNDHATIAASALINALEEMSSMVEGFLSDRSSEQAQEFHRVAILQAKPEAPPSLEGKTDWQYDKNTDTYNAV